MPVMSHVWVHDSFISIEREFTVKLSQYVLCVLLATTVLCRVSLCMAQEDAADALRKAAREEASRDVPERMAESSFTSGALGLQKLNPEISVTGDILWSYKDFSDSGGVSDFLLRGLGLHFEAYLDPYTRFKAAASFDEHDGHLGEAYMTRFGLLPHVNVTAGKFRQQFGVVNRWHKHGLDQVDFPLPLRQIFGPGGLNQSGIAIDWVIPGIAGFSHELILEITDGENDRVFAENTDGRPTGLARYKVYRDLSYSTYAEVGVSGLVGQNNEWQVLNAVEDRNLDVTVVGADFTVMWEPVDKMRYRNFTWRSEAYFMNKRILALDGSGEDAISPYGAYSYVEGKISRTLAIGLRADYFVPDTKDYADFVTSSGASSSLSPLAMTQDDVDQWQVGPYINWHQSPFVHFRIEYNHMEADGVDVDEDVIWLQCIFAAGPHKHERY